MGFESFPAPNNKLEQSALPIEGSAVRASMARYIESMSRRVDANIAKNTNHEFEIGKRFDQVVVNHGNLEIEMLGVAHIAETLPQHREKIETAIKNSNLLVLEKVAEAEDVNLARNRSKNAVSSGGFFFLEVERMARRYGKDLVTADPFYGYGADSDEHEEVMEKRERLVKDVRRLVGSIGMSAAAGGGVLSLAAMIKASAGDKEGTHSEVSQGLNLSRRGFLKLAVAGAGATLGHKIADAASEDENYGKFEFGDPTTDYQLNDYRDVAIAEGLDTLARSFTQKKKIALLFGAGHIKGIRYYLENPDIRRAKLVLYKPFREIAEPMLRAYHFETDKRVTPQDAEKGNFGEWKKNLEVTIKAPE